jgi:hypothetical protein
VSVNDQIIWKDPPKRKRNRLPDPTWVPLLRENPGRSALVATLPIKTARARAGMYKKRFGLVVEVHPKEGNKELGEIYAWHPEPEPTAIPSPQGAPGTGELHAQQVKRGPGRPRVLPREPVLKTERRRGRAS